MSTKEGIKSHVLYYTVHSLQTLAVSHLVALTTPLRHEGACVCFLCVCKSFQERTDRQTVWKTFFLHMKCHVSVWNKQSLVCGCVELSWCHEGCFPLALIWRSRFKRRTRLYRCCPGDIWALASEAAQYYGVSPHQLLKEINMFMPSWVSYLCSQGSSSGNSCSWAKPYFLLW